MIEKKISTSFFIADFNELSSVEQDLINKAKQILKTSYSSYSGFSVGASVMFEDQQALKALIKKMLLFLQGFVQKE